MMDLVRIVSSWPKRASSGAVRVALSVCLATVPVMRADATTTLPLTFEQIAYGADFIGVVRCVTAGGIVARYEVEEAWKGERPSEPFTIRATIDHGESQFPVALVGERYAVAAYRVAESNLISTTPTIPLWWRQVRSEYSLPPYRGQVRLPDRIGGIKRSFGLDARSLDELRAATIEYVALPDDRQRLRLLQGLVRKYVPTSAFDRSSDSAEPMTDVQRSNVFDGEALGPAFQAVLDYARCGNRHSRLAVKRILGGLPMDDDLEKFLKLDPKSSPIGETYHTRICLDRLDPAPSTRWGARSERTESLPGKDEIVAIRAAMDETSSPYDLSRSLRILAEHDPVQAVGFLVAFEGRPASIHDANLGYVLGSVFAANCGGDRPRHLESLLQAADPMVRAAGAVYLAFVDEPRALPVLRRLCDEEGDPGGWAALSLARRGEKSAMPRALELLKDPCRARTEVSSHRNLQRRVLVLLSNSASVSGTPPIENRLDGWSEDGSQPLEAVYRYYLDYWSDHVESIRLSDPWLDHCRRVEVD